MDVKDYVATLCIRPAELSGLKELPGGTKDRLTPLVLLAPWLATSPLSKAIDKFEAAFPDRPYFLDVDRYYKHEGVDNEARLALAELVKKPANLGVWFELLASYPNANPCLLLSGATVATALSQIKWARENNRQFCLRFDLSSGGAGFPEFIPALLDVLGEEGAVDYSVVFDFGLVGDALEMAAVATGFVKTFFSKISSTIPIVLTCTSFPTDFTVFDGIDQRKFTNRRLLGQVRKATNHPKLIYGDWGSTRPRSYKRANSPKARIDYPTDDGWVIARDNGKPITFPEAAKRIVASPDWSGKLGVWGEQLIEGAAIGQELAIDTMPKMYSARINIHLHRQAFYGILPPPEALDEAWDDDF